MLAEKDAPRKELASPKAEKENEQAKSVRIMPALTQLKTDPKAQTDEAVALGHALFFDKRLSVDGSVACYSCHQNENGNGGATPTAIGAKGKKLSRHSPVIWNVAYLPRLYWDGRASSLEAQAKGAWGGGNMGVGKENLEKKAEEIAQIPGYKKLFAEAYPGKKPSADLIAQALSAYERTLICDNTAYDRYVKGDKEALNQQELAGYDVFMGKGMCASCHTPPLFTSAGQGEGSYFNVGIGTKDIAEENWDIGRMKISQKDDDKAAFKTPSLRNVSKSAPYFHDGSVETLEEAVHLMASGGIANSHLSPLVKDRNLSSEEKTQLVAFLKSLYCNQKLNAPQLP